MTGTLTPPDVAKIAAAFQQCCSSSQASWLSNAYYISQITLVLIAAAAAVLAYKQISTVRMFEITKFLQEDRFRDARRIVIQEIADEESLEWEQRQHLNDAASICCAHYNVVWEILEDSRDPGLKRFFIRIWARSIVKTYAPLEAFIHRRGENSDNPYPGYTKLFEEASKYRQGRGLPK